MTDTTRSQATVPAVTGASVAAPHRPAAPPPAAPSTDLGKTATGLDPRFAAMLAYLVGWVTGLLFYFLERDNRYIRFHAMQSIVGLGAIWALGVSFLMLSFMSVFLSATAFNVLRLAAELTWVVGMIVWLICLYKAYSGEEWKLPIAGEIAARASRRTA